MAPEISTRVANKLVKKLASYGGYSYDEMVGPKKYRSLSLRRAETIWVLRHFGLSLVHIGGVVNRDHASVFYAIRRINELRKTTAGYEEDTDRLVALARHVVHQEKENRFMRERLPDLREGATHHFVISDRDGREHDGYITTGHYEDGRLGEVFIRFGKSGEASALLDQWAVSTSYALQYGVPPRELLQKFVGTRFEPEGSTGNKDIPRCTSVLDYVARWLLSKVGGVE